jgi:DNA-damage-inducible protein J
MSAYLSAELRQQYFPRIELDLVYRMMHNGNREEAIMKTERINARIEPRLKTAAEKVLAKVGLSPAEAIRLFYKQIELHQGLPFEVRIPNKKTLKAMRDADERRHLKRYKNLDEFKESLGL